MKKILTVLSILLFAMQLQAQDLVILNQVKATNGKIKSFDADLQNTLTKPKKTTTQVGKLYFVKPNEFSAVFTTGKFMTVNEQKIKMDLGIFRGTFKIKEGGMMKSLASIFLYGFQGRIQDLANENNYSLTTKTEDGYHVITANTKKKKLIGIGYKTIIFRYHADSFLLKEIVVIDYNDNHDSYVISNVKYDVPIDPKTFQF